MNHAFVIDPPEGRKTKTVGVACGAATLFTISVPRTPGSRTGKSVKGKSDAGAAATSNPYLALGVSEQ
jgi:hypothetical protein